MTSRNSRTGLRTKITAVLVSLAALWAFAAFVTVKDGVSLVWFATLEQEVAKPALAAVDLASGPVHLLIERSSACGVSR